MGDELGQPHAGQHEIPEEIRKDAIRHTKGYEYSRDEARVPPPMKHDAPNSGFSNAPPHKLYLPALESHRHLAADIQAQDPDSILNSVKQLIAWRKSQPALVNGKMKLLNTEGDVLAFVRRNREQTLLCVHNVGSQNISFMLDRPTMDAIGLDEKTLRETGLEIGATITLGPGGSVFPGERAVRGAPRPATPSAVFNPGFTPSSGAEEHASPQAA